MIKKQYSISINKKLYLNFGNGYERTFWRRPFQDFFWQANLFDLINEGLTGARVKKMVWGYTFVVCAVLIILLNSQTD